MPHDTGANRWSRLCPREMQYRGVGGLHDHSSNQPLIATVSLYLHVVWASVNVDVPLSIFLAPLATVCQVMSKSSQFSLDITLITYRNVSLDWCFNWKTRKTESSEPTRADSIK